MPFSRLLSGASINCAFGLIGSAELNVAAAQFRGAQQRRGQDHVALELELGGGFLTRSRAGMPRDEHQFIDLRPREIDLQVMGCFGGFAVLVGAQHREIEGPARKLKIVGIAAERGDVRLGCEYQPDIVVALVLVEKVLTAFIQA